ncbi:FAD-binding protein [Actinomadura sp. NPDC047616]|uniref:FAD-binding protein n=1 Tax=Actinomadura sp. NPDC047616 TaxID=3155914 RepID=UPI0033D5F12A
MDDFGGIVRTSPLRVARPSCARDVADAVQQAEADGLAVAARGCGHSTAGESQAPGGVVIDMRGMRAAHEVGRGHVTVDAGATWREVLDATLPHGLTPPVLTDHLDLTVGGTLSAGGVGGASHVHGTQAANVLELEVVTRQGEIAVCSASRRRGLFDAVRAGMGRYGVITQATLRLVAAPERVLVCTVPCRDAGELVGLQRRVRADHVSGQAKPAEAGWRFEAKAVVYDGTRPPEGVEPSEVERLAYRDFADRMRPDVAELVRLGEWARPHPWAMVFLPAARAAELIGEVLAGTTAGDLGLSGVVLVKALRIGRVPMLRSPADPVLFGMLRTASPGCRTAAEMTAANRRLHERATAAGGTPYPAA